MLGSYTIEVELTYVTLGDMIYPVKALTSRPLVPHDH